MTTPIILKITDTGKNVILDSENSALPCGLKILLVRKYQRT